MRLPRRCEEAAHHLSLAPPKARGEAVTAWQYVRTSQFWFESFQNWQSEFLAVAAIIGGSVYLRQRSSSQSKPVHAPNAQTGD